MEENFNTNQVPSQSPGAAIGSFIVIAILVAGAVYILGGQLTKKPDPAPIPTENEVILEATTTLQI